MIKEGYKETEIGVIPEEWELKELKDISEIISGGTPKTGVEEYWLNGNISWATPTDITSNGKYISDTEKRITGYGLKNSSANMIPEGAILMTSRATIGERCINTKPMCTNQGFKSFFCKENCINEYLYYYIDILKPELFRNSSGSTFKEISKSKVEVLKVALPPLLEQKLIAEILSTTDNHIEKLDKTIEDYQLLKKGMMKKLLTEGIGHTEFKETEIGKIPKEWEISNIGKCVNKIVGGGTPARSNIEFYNGCIPWVTVKDLDNKFYKADSTEYISEKAIKNSATNLIEKKNVIVATRMGLGRGFINTVPVAINQDLKALYLKNNINPEFFLFWYLSNANTIEKLGTGTTVKGIRLETLKEISVAVPTLPEQQCIAKILSDLDNRIELYRQEREDFIQLKKALMEQLLTGKIRVNR